ncbi:MAG: hypothetical protein RXR19_05830 [Nitrososphaeria archaeon]
MVSRRMQVGPSDHFVYDQSLKNLMKRMNEYIKDRNKGFLDPLEKSSGLKQQRIGLLLNSSTTLCSRMKAFGVRLFLTTFA